MVTITITKDIEIIKEIFLNPKLLPLVACGVDINRENFALDPNCIYGLAKEDGKTVGLMIVRPLTTMLVELHPMVLPQYWGNEVSIRFGNAIKELFSKTMWSVGMTPIPASAEHAVRFAHRMDGKLVGTIKKCILFDNKVTDLLTFRFDLCPQSPQS